MLLAINIGNSNTALALFRKGKIAKVSRLKTNKLLTHRRCLSILSRFVGQKVLNQDYDIIICSVVPPLTSVYKQAAKQLNRVPVIVGPNLDLGIKIKYKNPSEVGADRLADAVAAYNLYRGAVIVVDLGTATTFNAVSAKGEFLGGPIAPGIFSSSIALASTTSQLFRVRLSKPNSVLSKSTADALKAGIIYGAAGQIDFIVSRMERELKRKCRVVATGGGASLVRGISKGIQEVDPDLTLKGLFFIHKRLTGKNRR